MNGEYGLEASQQVENYYQGNIYSTSEDLFNFLFAIEKGELLSKISIDSMSKNIFKIMGLLILVIVGDMPGDR